MARKRVDKHALTLNSRSVWRVRKYKQYYLEYCKTLGAFDHDTTQGKRCRELEYELLILLSSIARMVVHRKYGHIPRHIQEEYFQEALMRIVRMLRGRVYKLGVNPINFVKKDLSTYLSRWAAENFSNKLAFESLLPIGVVDFSFVDNEGRDSFASTGAFYSLKEAFRDVEVSPDFRLQFEDDIRQSHRQYVWLLHSSRCEGDELLLWEYLVGFWIASRGVQPPRDWVHKKFSYLGFLTVRSILDVFLIRIRTLEGEIERAELPTVDSWDLLIEGAQELWNSASL